MVRSSTWRQEILAEFQDVGGEEQAGVHELDLHDMADTDGDGEIQHTEALRFVDGLRNYSHDQSLALFQAQDADSSQGLNGREFAEALEAWGGGCASHHVATYCSGATRRCCCHHGPTWSSCGCTHHYSSCGGGYHGGGYHAGGGGYHYSSYHHYGYR